MNGATTDPCVKIISAPINNIVIMSGANQNFFLTFRNDQISLTKSINASIKKIK